MKLLSNNRKSRGRRNGRHIPAPFRDPSARQLGGSVPEHFERFYRETLRYCTGARLRSRQVSALYAEWAIFNTAPSLNLQQLKRAMVNIGHTHFNSNGIWYGDVRLAGDAPHIPDNFPEGPPPPAREHGIIGRIDRIALELEQLRREVAAGMQ
jgi:hypothetical protein